jgi:hypothetical protein
MPSKSKINYDKNPASKAKKNAYNREYYKKKKESLNASRAERKKYREDAVKRGVNVNGKDVAHTKNGLRIKSAKANRGSKSDSAGDKRARGKKK